MNNFEFFKAEKGRFERKKAKEGRVDGGGRKAFPTRGSQEVRGVKVDISMQTTIIPANRISRVICRGKLSKDQFLNGI